MLTTADPFKATNVLRLADGTAVPVFAWWQGSVVRLYCEADWNKLASIPDHSGTYVVDWTKNGKTLRVWGRNDASLAFTEKLKGAALEKLS